MVDPRVELAESIFCLLSGERSSRLFDPDTEIRSEPYTDTVDVRLADGWYRIRAERIVEPVNHLVTRIEVEEAA